MLDSFLRVHDYLRLSVTPICNFRCNYCMPTGNICTSRDIMSDEEIFKLVEAFRKLGIKHLKITGGEPLTRPNILKLTRKIVDDFGLDVTMTTNGSLIEKNLEELIDSKISSINISLDTVDEKSFNSLTGGYYFKDTINGILLIKDHIKTKLNAVIKEDEREEDILKLVDFAEKNGLILRFIEMMPIGYGKKFRGYPTDEILKIIEGKYKDFKLSNEKFGNGPSIYYEFLNKKMPIGIIDAVSHNFCESCNRLRVTSEGDLKLCLEMKSIYNVRSFTKGEISFKEFKEDIESLMKQKPKKNNFSSNEKMEEDFRGMSQIGG